MIPDAVVAAVAATLEPWLPTDAQAAARQALADLERDGWRITPPRDRADDHQRSPYLTPEDKFAALTEATEDGHIRWTGPRAVHQMILVHRGTRWSPMRLAFRLHYGREPIGLVLPSCGTTGCLLGAHLDDGPARARLRAAYAALGL